MMEVLYGTKCYCIVATLGDAPLPENGKYGCYDGFLTCGVCGLPVLDTDRVAQTAAAWPGHV